jgi:transcriptional regulator with XRE-family HTH domain
VTVVPELIVQAIGDAGTSAGAPITNGMTASNGDEPRDGIGALFKRFREEQRVTQRELAAAAAMSVGALRDLEQGRTVSPRWTTVEELAAVLGLGQAQRAELQVAFRASRRGTARRRERPAGRPPGLRIDILGPLVAWRDGALVALGPARQRAVLGLLAVHAGASVPREAIVDMLWGERPPASAVAEVQLPRRP